MSNTGIILDNFFEVKAMPKTTVKAFKDIKVGMIVRISLELSHGRGGYNDNLYALFPLVNGVPVSIKVIYNLQQRGLVLEQLQK